MSEVTLNGQQYLIGKLNARQQWHIARRLLPFISQFMPLIGAIQRAQQEPDVPMNPPLEIQLLAAVSGTMSAMSEPDVDYILDHCLAAIRFRSGTGNWAPLAPNGARMLASDAADAFDVQVRLVGEVLYANLSNFSLENALPLNLTVVGNGQTTFEQSV